MLVGCSCIPHAHLTVLNAAEHRLPAHVEQISVVTQSGPTDLALQRSVVRGFVAAIERDDSVTAIPSSRSDLEPRAICAAEGTDAVLMLTRLQTRWATHLTEEGQAHLARRVAVVQGDWTLYDAQGTPLDEAVDSFTAGTWDGQAGSPGTAKEALPADQDTVDELAFSLGVAYAKRITSSVEDVRRPYFVRGDPRLAAAHLPVRSGDWQRAEGLWREVANDPGASARARSRARHNLALAHEVHGNFAQAIREASLAFALHPTERVQRYVDALEARSAWHRRLRFPVVDDWE